MKKMILAVLIAFTFALPVASFAAAPSAEGAEFITDATDAATIDLASTNPSASSAGDDAFMLADASGFDDASSQSKGDADLSLSQD